MVVLSCIPALLHDGVQGSVRKGGFLQGEHSDCLGEKFVCGFQLVNFFKCSPVSFP